VNVFFVSQCSKRALVETRRILDQFAERRGDCAWQTPITQAGLDTVRRMLKKTARKNTSVACHWIRGRDHSELVWIVGDARRFNEQGAVPTNTTEQDVLRSETENDWLSAEDIRLLAVLASLFHDLGKSSLAFQKKLRATTGRPIADAYRHEWVSLRLFEAFVGLDSDENWLKRLSRCDSASTDLCLSRLSRDDRQGARSPFKPGAMPPLAHAVGWLILTHHRLPLSADRYNSAGLKYLLAPVLSDWNGARAEATLEEKQSCWEFPAGLPFSSRDWCRRVQSCAREMLGRPLFVQNGARYLDDPYVMHLARLSLMLADHHYSSQPSEPRYGDAEFPLFANTDRSSGQLKQRLDEHLSGVASHARRVVRVLPRLEHSLPRIARHKAFQRRSKDERFRWQDKAYDLAISLRQASAEQGFFGINMASTGCGKTLANGRILYGLADPQRGARFTVALGLRTLTLQTGNAYRERLGLGDDDLAVLVGGGAVRELFELHARETKLATMGSESSADLLPDDSHVHFEGNVEDGPLKRWLISNPDANKLLQAPVLACTIDHLVPATESLRGGRQIAPMLRLMTADLVLDEPDDFDLGDLPALSRLVHWAGLLGSRVLLSSATLPPSLVEGLFAAYRAGRESFQKNRGTPGRHLAIPCAWFDEFRSEAFTSPDADAFQGLHAQFVSKRLHKLRQTDPRRQARIEAISSSGKDLTSACDAVAEALPMWMLELHQKSHTVDPKTGTKVSFGLVRMANINPLIEIAERLYENGAPDAIRLHLCVYHARHPLLMRSAIEHLLDTTLQRSKELAVFDQVNVRAALDSNPETDHLFVVLASPVAEVGRDHDYDWAVVEPSSMRSIIQLAGRIRRHRAGKCESTNIILMNSNLKALQGARPAFTRPGFEGKDSALLSHSLSDILLSDQLAPLDAGSRIQERAILDPKGNLVDLEHHRLRALMLGSHGDSSNFVVPHWWTTRAHLIGELQRSQRFREGTQDFTYAWLPRDDEDTALDFSRKDETWTKVGNLCRPLALSRHESVQPWGPCNYEAELAALAETLERELLPTAKRYGTVQLRESTQGWAYHPALGFKQLH
jgi:CRISPR-associated endonuclease/helicase Cas3